MAAKKRTSKDQSEDPAMDQLEENQRVLDYDTKEFTIELLVSKFGTGGDNDDIFVPTYQRRFNWEPRRQSRLIESILIGLPIPFLFFADSSDGRLEVVDGRQRLGTCKAFLEDELELEGLERLDRLNGSRFSRLSKAQQRRFRNRTIRSVVLSQRASEDDRRDLFDRINTGSLLAEPAETRRGSNKGPVTELIDDLAADALFKSLCPLSDGARAKREPEELLTRFFAISEGLEGYRDRIGEFLNKWLRRVNEAATKRPELLNEYRQGFHDVMRFVQQFFPHGFRKKATSTTTPRVRFDAIAVGTWKALKEDPTLARTGPSIDVEQWLDSDDFFVLTTSSAANVRSRIENRTEYVQLMLLGREDEAQERAPGKEQ